jgi:hypothetical protein
MQYIRGPLERAKVQHVTIAQAEQASKLVLNS